MRTRQFLTRSAATILLAGLAFAFQALSTQSANAQMESFEWGVNGVTKFTTETMSWDETQLIAFDQKEGVVLRVSPSSIAFLPGGIVQGTADVKVTSGSKVLEEVKGVPVSGRYSIRQTGSMSSFFNPAAGFNFGAVETNSYSANVSLAGKKGAAKFAVKAIRKYVTKQSQLGMNWYDKSYNPYGDVTSALVSGSMDWIANIAIALGSKKGTSVNELYGPYSTGYAYLGSGTKGYSVDAKKFEADTVVYEYPSASDKPTTSGKTTVVTKWREKDSKKPGTIAVKAATAKDKGLSGTYSALVKTTKDEAKAKLDKKEFYGVYSIENLPVNSTFVAKGATMSSYSYKWDKKTVESFLTEKTNQYMY